MLIQLSFFFGEIFIPEIVEGSFKSSFDIVDGVESFASYMKNGRKSLGATFGLYMESAETDTPGHPRHPRLIINSMVN